MVQQLQFPEDLSWRKGSSTPAKGSNLKNQRDSYLHGSAAWPTYSVSCPGEVIKWCLGMKVSWVYAPLLHLGVSSVSWGGK